MDSMEYSIETQIHLNKSIGNFDVQFHRQWFAKNWHFSIYASIVYMILVANGLKWMKHRKAYDLKNVIFFWNMSLSFFSICGTIKLLPELLSVLTYNGLYHSICKSSFKSDPSIEYWMWLFTWSKLIEFGDTVFIVLRKQKLITLHWTHHVITMIYCFFVFSDLPAIGRYGISINFMIHSFMYFYYGLKVIKIWVPVWVAKAITTLQTLQMVVGVVTGSSALYNVIKGHDCDGTVANTMATTAMSAYYLVLFVHFFVKKYLDKSSVEQKTK